MANEALPEQTISVPELSKYEDLGAFYRKKKYSDVTLIVEGKEIKAHKIVLAARSQCFESLLPDDPTMTTLIIPDASFEAFQRILKYIYTGKMSIDSSNEALMLDVLKLSHAYTLPDLEKSLSQKLRSLLDMTNVFTILNKANDHDFNEMKQGCYAFIDEHFLEILETDLNTLPQKIMINFLQKRPVSVSGIKIFQVIVNWCTQNEDTNDLVKKCIDLTSLSIDCLLTTVWPSKLFDNEELMAAMKQIREKENESHSIMDINIATSDFKARVISGIRTYDLLKGNEDFSKSAYHPIGNRNGITIELNAVYRFNHIRMKLSNTNDVEDDEYVDKSFYRYYIEISKDQNKWENIIDYSKYDCRSCQNLYFEQQEAKYIRIYTHSSKDTNFKIVSFEIYYKSQIPKLVNQIVRPIENVATEDMGAFVAEGRNPQYLLNGDINSYVTWHEIGSEHIIVQLAQPYMISSMRLLLGAFNESYKYSYFIETSVDMTEWQLAVDRSNKKCENWQDLHFEERPVIYIKITGTWSEHPYCFEYFSCQHFECPISKLYNKK